MSSFAPVGWTGPAGVCERLGEGALDGQLDRDDVPEDGDPVQLPVDVGRELGHPEQDVTQVLTPVLLAVDHVPEDTVLGEQVDERLDVQDVTLRVVVRLAHDLFDVGGHCELSL